MFRRAQFFTNTTPGGLQLHIFTKSQCPAFPCATLCSFILTCLHSGTWFSAGVKEAHKWDSKACSIREELGYDIIHKVLSPKGISYVRASGEADGQQAALNLDGTVHAVNTIGT